MARYIFGECKEQPFYLKKTQKGWKTNLEDFPVDCFNEKTSRAIAVGKLLEFYQGDVDIFSLKLSEARTAEDLKKLLKSKLGCLSTDSSCDVESLLDKDGFLTEKAQKELEDIVSGTKKMRVLKTRLLRKAWITAKGSNKNIRNIGGNQPVYMFAYLQEGKKERVEIIEGATSLKSYEVKLKSLNRNEIHERFEEAIKAIEDSCTVNNFDITGNGKSGEVFIATFTKKATPTESKKVREAFISAFTSPDPDLKNKELVKLVRNLEIKDGNDVTTEALADLRFENSAELEFPYSAEEISVARDALTILGKDKSDDKTEPDTDKDDKDKTVPETGKMSPEEKTARKNIKDKGWNKKDAAKILDGLADRLPTNTHITSKKRLTKALKPVAYVDETKLD